MEKSYLPGPEEQVLAAARGVQRQRRSGLWRSFIGLLVVVVLVVFGAWSMSQIDEQHRRRRTRRNTQLPQWPKSNRPTSCTPHRFEEKHVGGAALDGWPMPEELSAQNCGSRVGALLL